MSIRKSLQSHQWLNTVFLVGALLVFVAFLGMTVWGDEGLLHLIRLNRMRSEILSENQRLLKENLFYLEDIRSAKSVRYQEQKARSELGMIRQNETVFVVPEP